MASGAGRATRKGGHRRRGRILSAQSLGASAGSRGRGRYEPAASRRLPAGRTPLDRRTRADRGSWHADRARSSFAVGEGQGPPRPSSTHLGPSPAGPGRRVLGSPPTLRSQTAAATRAASQAWINRPPSEGIASLITPAAAQFDRVYVV